MSPKRAAEEGLDELLGLQDEEPAAERAAEGTDEGTGHSLPHGPGRRRRGGWVKSLLAVLVSLAVLIGGGLFAYHKIGDAWHAYQGADYAGNGVSAITVNIDSGQSVEQMGQLLVSEQVVASSRAFMRAAKKNPKTDSIQSGTYRMKTHMSATAAVAVLVDPSNIVNHMFTVPEGLRDSEVFARINQTTGIPVKDFEAAATNPTDLGLPSWAKSNPEGLLFPNTYTFDDKSTATSVMAQMVSQFNQVSQQLDLVKDAAAIGRTPQEVLIVASIVERETVNPDYGPQIAEVFYNRLDKGMKLQSDATVAYANNLSGAVTTTDAQRAVNSPYNTYVVQGLPPGPISNPGKNALQAALHPATGDLLYFVAVNPDTGETKFASNEQDHEKNVQEFQAWCQANSGRCG